MNICLPWLERPSSNLQELIPANKPCKKVAVNQRTVDVNARSVALESLRDSEAMRKAFTPRELKRRDAIAYIPSESPSESPIGSPPPTPPRPGAIMPRSNPIPIPKANPEAVFNAAEERAKVSRINRGLSGGFSESEFMGRLSL